MSKTVADGNWLTIHPFFTALARIIKPCRKLQSNNRIVIVHSLVESLLLAPAVATNETIELSYLFSFPLCVRAPESPCPWKVSVSPLDPPSVLPDFKENVNIFVTLVCFAKVRFIRSWSKRKLKEQTNERRTLTLFRKSLHTNFSRFRHVASIKTLTSAIETLLLLHCILHPEPSRYGGKPRGSGWGNECESLKLIRTPLDFCCLTFCVVFLRFRIRIRKPLRLYRNRGFL